jgi:16S rRNA (guanine527-N7)-methyltransferase
VFVELLREKLRGVADLSAEQVRVLEWHYQLLVRWNKTLNLTTITSVEEAVERHYCESIFLGSHLPDGPLRIVDAGSGAGFPGFPVAVIRPDCTVTLVESHQRKSVFLREASRKLKNVRVEGKRAEDIKDEFDHVISRAVSYSDLVGALKNLAVSADLLTGIEEPLPELGFEWREPAALPWGKARFLRRGVRRAPHNDL